MHESSEEVIPAKQHIPPGVQFPQPDDAWIIIGINFCNQDIQIILIYICLKLHAKIVMYY
jgi:hypothetical protein